MNWIQRLINGDRSPVPTEVPSDQQMEQWKRVAVVEYLNGGEPTWRTAALLAFAEGRRQAQSIKLPPPSADPVATTENLWDLFTSSLSADSGASHADARRAIYQRGRADERTAILRVLGVEP